MIIIEPINYTIKNVWDSTMCLDSLSLNCKNNANDIQEDIILLRSYVLPNIKFQPGQNLKTWATFGNPEFLTAAKLGEKPAYLPPFTNNILGYPANTNAIDHRFLHYKKLLRLFDSNDIANDRIFETLLFLLYSKKFLAKATETTVNYKKLLEKHSDISSHLKKWISCMNQNDTERKNLGQIQNAAMFWVLNSLVNERYA